MMTSLLLVQMSGAPGTGKSTVARAIGRRYGAMVLDHDVTKTALLDGGVPWDLAGRASYEALFALARSALKQGLSVVLDSPCFYQRILDEGLGMAAATGASYRYIECSVDDLAEIGRRLQRRAPMRSQRRDLHLLPIDANGEQSLTGEELFREWARNMKRPSHSYLRIDTSRPVQDCLAEAFAFLDAH